MLLAAAAAAPDPVDKRALYAELQQVWAEELPGLPLYQELRVDVAPRALERVHPSPNQDPLTWNAAEWRFAPNVN